MLNRLNPQTVSFLQDRLADEFAAFYLYRNAANWCANRGYEKAAKYFANESHDETLHAQRIEKFLTDWNVQPSLPPIEAPESFISLPDVIEKAYEIEYDLLQSYSKNAYVVMNADPSSYKLFQKYMKIQVVSVAEYSTLLNKLELIDRSNPYQIYMFEKKEF
jgi:ferritin